MGYLYFSKNTKVDTINEIVKEKGLAIVQVRDENARLFDDIFIPKLKKAGIKEKSRGFSIKPWFYVDLIKS